MAHFEEKNLLSNAKPLPVTYKNLKEQQQKYLIETQHWCL